MISLPRSAAGPAGAAIGLWELAPRNLPQGICPKESAKESGPRNLAQGICPKESAPGNLLECGLTFCTGEVRRLTGTTGKPGMNPTTTAVREKLPSVVVLNADFATNRGSGNRGLLPPLASGSRNTL